MTSEQRMACVKRYTSGESSTTLASDYGCSEVAVASLLRRRGVTMRTNAESHASPINKLAFDTITPESAYWVGMLLADGCIFNTQICLALKASDHQHVEAFRDFLGSTNKIVRNEVRSQFSVKNQYMVDQLKHFGITERKSHTALPAASLTNNRDFWRGVIDGDGSIYVSRKGTPKAYSVRLYGSKSTCDAFCIFVATNCGISATTKPHKTIHMVAISGIRKSTAVCKTLYDDCGICLSRKQRSAEVVIDVCRCIAPRIARVCSIDGCEHKHRAKGYCRNHYYKHYFTEKRHNRYLKTGV